MVGKMVHICVGHISIFDLAHLAVLTKPHLCLLGCTTSDLPGYRASSNSLAFDVLLVNSERIVTPSRHG